MIGISKERLVQIANETHDSDDTNMAVLSLLGMLTKECRELDSWMPINEFLKSGFEGACWVCYQSGYVYIGEYLKDYFYHDFETNFDYEDVTHVMPLHKPEPPK